MIGMTKAVFIGFPGALAKAYPTELRRELEKSFAFPVPEQTAESAGAADLREIEVAFGTWNMRRLDREFLDAAPKLRAVFYAAGSVKGFATPEAYERGITICGAWRANAIPVAEYTMSVILLSLKRFWQISRSAKNRGILGFDEGVVGAYHSKVGLVSLGAIGRHVAKLLSAFEVDILAYDPFCNAEQAREAGVTLVSLEELFRVCEVVSIHTPLLPQTRGMIGAPLVRSMKTGATLINTSRGLVLDEEAVLEVFREREDLTAVLDVTVKEPPAEDSLIHKLDNIVRTPHIAGSMGSEIARMGDWMAGEARRFVAGEPLKHQITYDMLDSVA